MRTESLQTFILAVAAGLAGCSAAENGNPSSRGGASNNGGSANTGGVVSAGGSTAVGGAPQSGGATSAGGTVSTGGVPSTGGTVATGGSGSGGAPCTNVRPTGTEWDEATCDQWATETTECNNAWMITGNYCNESCGRCSSGGTGGSGGVATGGTSGGGSGGVATGGTGGTAPVNCAGTPVSGGTQHCSSNQSGNVGGGYSYTIWSSGGGGCITPHGVNATFGATWNNSGDFLARVGLALGSTKKFDQYGAFAADFAHTKTGTGGGYSYIGIYGWSVNPLHEYYIIDDWYGSRPSFAGDKVGEFVVDGDTYDILTHTQVNQPAITGGNATFVQFWSLRQNARQCGHISISEHFKAWAGLGLTLGNMEEAKILVEVGGGQGSIEFTTATLTIQ